MQRSIIGMANSSAFSSSFASLVGLLGRPAAAVGDPSSSSSSPGELSTALQDAFRGHVRRSTPSGETCEARHVREVVTSCSAAAADAEEARRTKTSRLKLRKDKQLFAEELIQLYLGQCRDLKMNLFGNLQRKWMWRNGQGKWKWRNGQRHH